jgi:hypothetical protein
LDFYTQIATKLDEKRENLYQERRPKPNYNINYNKYEWMKNDNIKLNG